MFDSITPAEARANLEAAITEARSHLATAGIGEARALAALHAPEYNRRTVAGRRWRDARPWLSDAWTIQACRDEIDRMEAQP